MARVRDVPVFESARKSHPLLVRAINAIGRLASSSAPLEAEAIWRAARRGEVAEREPTPAAREALEVLLDALARNVTFTPIGRFSAKDDTVRLARTHLRVHAALEARPEIAETALLPQVFVVGWPRTGTTFLHQLLACDPANRTMPYWESFDPVPPPPGRPDRRREALDAMLGQLRFIAPAYDAIHPMTAESPEECVALFMNEFRSLQLDFQYRVPDYVTWLMGQDAGVAYDLYRRQLQLVQWHRPTGARHVLKDPTHIVHFETLVERFPEAKFVLTHRDPAEALSSIASLVAYTRALFTDDVDPRALGAELLGGHWPAALERSREIAAKLPPDRVVDVRHAALRRDPIATVRGIYDALGLDLSETAHAAMTRFLEARRVEPAGRHLHSLEAFGLSRDGVRERLADYCETMDV